MNKTEICMFCKCNCEHLQRKTSKRTIHNAGENLLKLSLSRMWMLGVVCGIQCSFSLVFSCLLFRGQMEESKYYQGIWVGLNIHNCQAGMEQKVQVCNNHLIRWHVYIVELTLSFRLQRSPGSMDSCKS